MIVFEFPSEGLNNMLAVAVAVAAARRDLAGMHAAAMRILLCF